MRGFSSIDDANSRNAGLSPIPVRAQGFELLVVNVELDAVDGGEHEAGTAEILTGADQAVLGDFLEAKNQS